MAEKTTYQPTVANTESKPPKQQKPFGNKKGKKPKQIAAQETPGPAEYPIKPPANTKLELPKPQNKERNDDKQKSIKTREDSVFSESVFSTERTSKPVDRDYLFQPSATGYTDLTNIMYDTLLLDKTRQVARELPIEALRYYHACIFWLRAIGLKSQGDLQLTQQEREVMLEMEHQPLYVFDPIYLALKTYGRIQACNKDTFYPQFPDIPSVVTGNVPGTLGEISVDNHNIYEELPVIGPTIDGMMRRIRGDNPNHPRDYQSVLAPAHTMANTNLQGFDRLTRVRLEALSMLEDHGVRGEAQLPSIADTGINPKLLSVISDYVSNLIVYKGQLINVLNIPDTGSLGQLISARPSPEDLNADTTAASTMVIMQSFSQESAVTNSVSETFGLCQWKENRQPRPRAAGQAVEPDRELAKTWVCLNYSAENDIPPEVIENRNERRNLPAFIYLRRFFTTADATHKWRAMVLRRMTTIR